MNRFILWAIPVIAFLPACNDTANKTQQLTNAELLKGVWTLNERLYDEHNIGNFKDIISNCEQGDTWHFLDSDEFLWKDDAMDCVPDVNEDKPGTWSLDSAEDVLSIKWSGLGAGNSDSYSIASIDEHNLTLHKRDASNPTAPVREKFILSR